MTIIKKAFLSRERWKDLAAYDFWATAGWVVLCILHNRWDFTVLFLATVPAGILYNFAIIPLLDKYLLEDIIYPFIDNVVFPYIDEITRK